MFEPASKGNSFILCYYYCFVGKDLEKYLHTKGVLCNCKISHAISKNNKFTITPKFNQDYFLDKAKAVFFHMISLG